MNKKIIFLILAFILVRINFQSAFATQLQQDSTININEKVNLTESNKEETTLSEISTSKDKEEVKPSGNDTNQDGEEVKPSGNNKNQDGEEVKPSGNDINQDGEEVKPLENNENKVLKSDIIDDKKIKLTDTNKDESLNKLFKIYKKDMWNISYRLIIDENEDNDDIVYCFNYERPEPPLGRENAVEYTRVYEEDIQNDSEINNKEKIKWVKNLLYVGYPNDPYNLLEKYNISDERARKYIQIALWEILISGEKSKDRVNKISSEKRNTYYTEIIRLAFCDELDNEKISFSSKISLL